MHDYQIQQELSRKADVWKVDELQRSVDNLKRENSNLQEDIRRQENSIRNLSSTISTLVQILIENEICNYQLHSLLRQ